MFNKIKFNIYPIVKGSFFVATTTIPFFLLFHKIASITYYSAISTKFNETTPSQEEYFGRIGFTMFIIGFFILNSAINQSFKVLTPTETKIILEDEELESKENCERNNNQEEK